MVYTNTGINNASTIVEKLGAAVTTEIDVRGKAVKFDADGNVVLASTAGEVVIGIALLTNSELAKANEDIDIQIKDNGYAMAGAAVSKGAALAVNADGKLVTATSGQFVVATALEAATADETIFRVAITKYQG